MKQAVRVTVTGAAGQIGYALLFRIASGAMLGEDQPVILQLLDITPALDALDGVKVDSIEPAFVDNVRRVLRDFVEQRRVWSRDVQTAPEGFEYRCAKSLFGSAIPTI